MTELRVKNRIDIDNLPLARRLVINHTEHIPRLNRKEIDRPRIHILQMHNQHKRCPRLLHIIPQRRRNSHMRNLPLMIHRLRHLPRRKRRRTLEHRQIHFTLIINHILQRPRHRIRRIIRLPRIPRPHLPRIEHRIPSRDQLQRLLRPKSEPSHQARKNLAIAQSPLLQVERIRTKPQRIHRILLNVNAIATPSNTGRG